MGFAIDNSTMTLPETGAGERVNPIARVLPSLTDMAVILCIVFLFTCMGGTHSLQGDGDTLWHIRTGQWIMANHQVPRTDMFSYTMPGTPWFAWEWLWDILFAVVYNIGGLAAVVLVNLALISFTMALTFRLVRRKCQNVLIAFGITALAIAGSSLHWLARPHLVTLFFGIIFFWMMESAKEAVEAGQMARANRLLWALPVISVLWVNLHAGFVLGVMIVGCYGAGEMAAWILLPGEERPAAFGRAWRFVLCSVGCFGASLINPYFISLHKHMFTFLHDSYSFEHIIEYQSVSFHSPMAWTWEIMMLVGAVGAFRELLRKQFVYAFMFVLWGHLGLLAGRNVPIFMLLAAPLAAKNLAELLSAVRQAPVSDWVKKASAGFDRLAAEVNVIDRVPRIHLTSIVALGIVAALVYAPQPPEKFSPTYDTKRYPAKALKFLGGAGITNRIFTDDEWGDYLLYTLYPTKIYIDGRSDMYGEKFCLNYIDIQNVKYDWEHSLARYGVDTILLPTTTSLAGALKESRNWRVVYDDHLAVIFRPVASAPLPGEKVSAVQPDGGTGRDRKVTKSEGRDPQITKTTT
jgi:hypothetical protein